MNRTLFRPDGWHRATAIAASLHDGIVVALRSNVRWCSDHLELRCRGGAVVRVLFAIDACDREVMA